MEISFSIFGDSAVYRVKIAGDLVQIEKNGLNHRPDTLESFLLANDILSAINSLPRHKVLDVTITGGHDFGGRYKIKESSYFRIIDDEEEILKEMDSDQAQSLYDFLWGIWTETLLV